MIAFRAAFVSDVKCRLYFSNTHEFDIAVLKTGDKMKGKENPNPSFTGSGSGKMTWLHTSVQSCSE